MLKKLENVASHVVGFKATGEVNKDDYEKVLIPALESKEKEHGHLHYIMVLDTPLKNFSIGAWMEDILQGLKHFNSWKKIAIVTDEHGTEKLVKMISAITPGETKTFTLSQLQEAKDWVAVE